MKKINQNDIKEILGVSLATVSRYLSGKRRISLDTALKVSKTLNVPVDIFTNADIQLKYFGKSYISKKQPKGRIDDK